MMTTLVIHSREPFLVKGLESILRQVGGFQVVPSCSTLAALREDIERSQPGMVLLEPGPEVTFTFLSEMKQTSQCKIVLWVNSITSELALQAMALGVRGILRKTLSPKLQVECLQRVQAGDVWFEKALLHGYDSEEHLALTRREGQILDLLSQGLKNREIATHLTVSEGTVKVYLTKLFQKVGARDRFELALYGLRNSLGRPFAAEDTPPTAEEVKAQTCSP
jgi:two-component system nitrate/nitrite response regulator NarP